jgi:hypothetical protein
LQYSGFPFNTYLNLSLARNFKKNSLTCIPPFPHSPIPVPYFKDSPWGVVKTRNAGISRNMPEYHGICWHMAEYHGISRHFPGIYRNIAIFSDGSHATVYKHGRLTTYFITKVMDLSHFVGK